MSISFSQVVPERAPAPSTRISWRMRWRLYRAARTDRRAGLPVGLAAATTPMLAELVALYRHASERERAGYLAVEGVLGVQLRRLDAHIEALRAELDRRAAEVHGLSEATPVEWLTTRYPGEELLPEVATRTRRLVTHQRQRAQAEAAHGQVRQDLDEELADRAEVQRRLHQRAELARSRDQLHREHTERLAAIYRRTLVKRHPERDELIALWANNICTVPDWAVDRGALPSEASLEVPA